ncbi:MAG: TIR domain-containing protein [Pseudomonadota bacterium]
MGRVFINYRREDSQYQADRLRELMKPWFDNPSGDIFMDVDSIPAGVDFVDYLDSQVKQCDALLVLIGKNWLTMTDQTGNARRLDSEADFVRIEIESALSRNIPVVPLLLDGVPMPKPEQLPASLKSLARRNAVSLSRLSFESDVRRLMETLPLNLKQSATEAQREVSSKPAFNPLKVIVPIVALTFLVGGYFVVQAPNSEPNQVASESVVEDTKNVEVTSIDIEPTSTEPESNSLARFPEPYASADLARGARTFRLCQSCHTLDAGGPNLVGPNLYGLFGSNVGFADGFQYSEALREADFTWTPELLNEWMESPRSFLPGNLMSFAGVRRETDRTALLAYLMIETAD